MIGPLNHVGVAVPSIKKAIENMHPLPKIGAGEDFSDIGYMNMHYL